MEQIMQRHPAKHLNKVQSTGILFVRLLRSGVVPSQAPPRERYVSPTSSGISVWEFGAGDG